MPNWCNNQIEISGPNKIIDQIQKIIEDSKDSKKDSQGLLELMCPMPKELRGTEKSSDDKKMNKQPVVDGFNNWYDWRLANWGTKWDVSEFYGDHFDRKYHEGNWEGTSTIYFGFDTAWSPPIDCFDKWLANNEECSMKLWYYEPGCDFAGEYDGEEDVCIEISKEASKGSTDKFWNTPLGRRLDGYFNIVESMAHFEADHMEDVHKYSKGEAVNVE